MFVPHDESIFPVRVRNMTLPPDIGQSSIRAVEEVGILERATFSHQSDAGVLKGELGSDEFWIFPTGVLPPPHPQAASPRVSPTVRIVFPTKNPLR